LQIDVVRVQAYSFTSHGHHDLIFHQISTGQVIVFPMVHKVVQHIEP
jgi:hypothetical protein